VTARTSLKFYAQRSWSIADALIGTAIVDFYPNVIMLTVAPGFANTVVYVTTRNVGPSINWEDVRSSAKELITELPRHMLRESHSMERSSEKVGSVYSISGPKLVTTTNSAEVSVTRTASPAIPSTKGVRVQTKEGIFPTYRAPITVVEASEPSEYSPSSEPEVEPSYGHKSGAIDSVNRWRQRQAEFGTPPHTPNMQLPVSPQMTPLGHLRGSSSLSSEWSFGRAPTPMIPRHVTPSNDGASVMSYQPSIGGTVPETLKPRNPVARSNHSNEWDINSQSSLISHIRKLSVATTTASSSSGSVASASNSRIEPATKGANLPFALYPGSNAPPGSKLGPRGEVPPEMLEASFSPPSTAGWNTAASTTTRI
jgi:hypothetical protein